MTSGSPTTVAEASGAADRRQIALDSATLAIRNVLQQALGFVRMLILPNLLGPVQYGSLATIMLVERYSTFLNLGIHTATLYKAPGLLAEGRGGEARAIHHVVLSFSIVTGAVAGALLSAAAWWMRVRLGPHLAPGLMAAGFIPILIVVRGALMTWTRANRDFQTVGRSGVISTVALLVLTIAFGWMWRTTGVVWGHVVAYAVALLYLGSRAGGNFRFVLPPRRIAEFVRFSVPISVVLSGIIIYLMTIDRITIVALLSVEDVGYYAIGQALTSVLSLVPNAVGEAIAPVVIAEAGRSVAAPRDRGLTALSSAMALAAGCLIAALPGIIQIGFPSYQPGILAAQLLCIGAYFETIGIGAHYVVISRGRVGTYISSMGALAAIAWVGLPIVCRGVGITGVAAAMVVLTAARTLWLLWMSQRLSGCGRLDAGRVLMTRAAPGIVAAAIPFAVQFLVDFAVTTGVAVFTITFVRVVATFVLLVTVGAIFTPASLRTACAAVLEVVASRRDPIARIRR